MTGASYEDQPEQPIVHDKRKIDPDTYERRAAEQDQADVASDGEQPSGAAAPAGEAGVGGADVPADEAARLQAEVLDLADQLARAKAEVYNTEQRFNAFVKRSREQEAAARTQGHGDAIEALIPVLDDIALARQHDELSGPFAAIAEKLEASLASRFTLTRYGAVGDAFDPELHEALMHQVDPSVPHAQVAMVAQPGYRRGETVLRPARVGVVGPE